MRAATDATPGREVAHFTGKSESKSLYSRHLPKTSAKCRIPRRIRPFPAATAAAGLRPYLCGVNFLSPPAAKPFLPNIDISESAPLEFAEQVRLIKSSKQVHSRWYLETYPEVAALGLDPAEHYLRYGAALGRNPGKNFDTRFYLETYPDAAESGLNPLVHYVLHGQALGYERRPPKNQTRRQIDIIRTKLLSLGFTERPLAELNAIADDSPDPEARALAARELALWHMREKSETGWQTALSYLSRARADAPDLDFRSKLATAELLCHYHLGQSDQGLAAYDRAALAGQVTPDVMLARVNFQPTAEGRVAWINATLARYGIEPVALLPDTGQPAYDRLTCAPLPKVSDGPRVSVLVAAYESEAMLPTALRSLQEQTWTNLEIIVIDDASPTPGTLDVAHRFAVTDPRIRVLRMDENGGAYVARNRGLDEATGEFVTLHDADDWSHPRKIETQVRFMEANPGVMGCTSEQARCTEALEFLKLRHTGGFVVFNTSSFLWRREPVRAELGYWDTVRFGADSEFMNRLRSVFGEEAVCAVPSGPLAFQRQTPDSVTSRESSSIDQMFFGARKEYDEAQRNFLKTTKTKRYSGKLLDRPFPAPEAMVRSGTSRQSPQTYDVIILGEFRYHDAETKALIEKLENLKKQKKKIGLVECHRYTGSMINGEISFCEEMRQIVDGQYINVLVFGDHATCKERWFHRTSIEDHRYLPDVQIYETPRKVSFEQKDKPTKSKNKHPLDHLRDGISFDKTTLKNTYLSSAISSIEDRFVLYRIIGNDLVPRHAKGQSRENVRFVLENEPDLPNCRRVWIVNRIFDQGEKAEILDLLENHSQEYIDIPFDPSEYRRIGWDFDCLPSPGFLATKEFQDLGPEQKDRVRTALYRLKNLYVMHNNGARNTALRAGRSQAKWVLPWDGNCFVTKRAWSEITESILEQPYLKYFAVPMQRMSDNALLLSEDFNPDPIEEPQMIFRSDAGEEFLESYPYGRRPKVELFWHLGITGPWDRWQDDPWEQPRRGSSPDAGAYGVAGWVARMFSGMKALEQQGDVKSFKNRGLQRQEAIIAAIDHIDRLVHPPAATGPVFCSPPPAIAGRRTSAPGNPVVKTLIANAEAALSDGPYSVVQKTTLPPSGDIHDYWHPAPYWWPNPAKPDGLPYIKKDGQRVPGTRMYEPESAKYDRTRLQLLFDNTTALALGWKLTGRKDFAAHGARLVRSWFLDPETRMKPHLTFAQVRMGHNKNQGVATGIIEFKDFYYTLDAVRLLEASGAFTSEDSAHLKDWLREYLGWLETSTQGLRECRSVNNHGTYYDLQTAAICAYLDDQERLRDIMLRAQSRLAQQITEDGVQPDEMKRSITQHYVFFNLQGLLNIFRVAQAVGQAPLDFTAEPGRRLRAALDWILRHDLHAWPYEQIDAFDHDRIWPLLKSAMELKMITRDELPEPYRSGRMQDVKPIFDPHDAVNPYWNLQ